MFPRFVGEREFCGCSKYPRYEHTRNPKKAHSGGCDTQQRQPIIWRPIPRRSQIGVSFPRNPSQRRLSAHSWQEILMESGAVDEKVFIGDGSVPSRRHQPAPAKFHDEEYEVTKNHYNLRRGLVFAIQVLGVVLNARDYGVAQDRKRMFLLTPCSTKVTAKDVVVSAFETGIPCPCVVGVRCNEADSRLIKPRFAPIGTANQRAEQNITIVSYP